MATDKREQILLYLQTLLGQVEGITAAYRDRGDFPKEKLPAAVLLDGTEEVRTVIQGHSLTRMPAAVFTLLPQIFVVLKPRYDNTNLTVEDANGKPISAPVGPELSAYRVKVLKAILSDINLAALLGNNGQIEYRGCDTDMQTGSTMVGQLQLHFAFSYVLDTAQL